MTYLITRDDIDAGKPFIMKWSRKPTDSNGAYNPGWKQQMESDRFLELIENRPSIMNDARFMPMDSIEYDVSFLNMEVDLQSMKALSGDNAGAQIDDINSLTESVPAFSRTKLVAEPFTAYTYTAKTFLKENIEKESFLTHIETVLAERAGYSAELIGMFGKKKSVGASASGYDHIDGLFEQLVAVRDAYDDAEEAETLKPYDPMGEYDNIDKSKPLVPQVKKMIAQFQKQKGKRASAKIYVSSTTEADLILEADQRPTEKGDNLYFQDGDLYLWGVPIVASDFLDDVRNGWVGTTVGEDEGEVTDLILMANPDSIVFGFLAEMESENTYEHQKKAYLSSVDIYYDVLLLLNKDALFARVVTPID